MDVEFKYVKFGSQWDGTSTVKYGVELNIITGLIFIIWQQNGSYNTKGEVLGLS